MATPLFGGSFAAPKQEQSFAQKLGGALQGFSAGLPGKRPGVFGQPGEAETSSTAEDHGRYHPGRSRATEGATG